MKNICLLFTLLTINTALLAQTNILRGRVLLEGVPVENISVLNRNTQVSVQTNDGGVFEIVADVDDPIVFFSESDDVESRRVYVKPYDLEQQEGIQIELTERAEVLEELEIDHTVSAASLGLRNMTYHRPNPVNMDLKAIYKAVVGLFEKDKDTEVILSEEQKIDLISYHFPESKLKELLGDPAVNIREFIYFAIRDEVLIQVLQEGNKNRMELDMTDKVYQFLSQKGK